MEALTFNSEEALLAYLLTSSEGRGLLREAAYAQDWLIKELLERHKATYVLVKVYRDGLVEVYGPNHIRAKIALLGRSETFPEYEIEREREMDDQLPERYQCYNFPKYRRAAALRGLWPCTKYGIQMES